MKFIYLLLLLIWLPTADAQEAVRIEPLGTYPADDAVLQKTYSSDGRHLTYAVQDGDNYRWVIDGKAEPSYPVLKDFVVFSREGERIGYVILEGYHRAYCIVDGEKHGPFNAVLDLAFSPDGQRWVAKAEGYEAHKQ